MKSYTDWPSGTGYEPGLRLPVSDRTYVVMESGEFRLWGGRLRLSKKQRRRLSRQLRANADVVDR